ncbi:MAG: hypothetical protein LBE37_00655 [Sphingobacterium sp.]|nr:hypothetical protein [Sphingobacterium sp.]
MNRINSLYYFPCKLIEHPDSFSIICSDFHFFDDYFGEKEAGGYAIERPKRSIRKQERKPEGGTTICHIRKP